MAARSSVTILPSNNLAADLRGLGEYQQARALDEDTLGRCRRLRGDDHLDTLTSANNLAADLHALGLARASGPGAVRRTIFSRITSRSGAPHSSCDLSLRVALPRLVTGH